ncbi:uncharacterized protein LOC121467534 isoform X1 [Drosophila elegans]|uniref:uncharacterized protein LOC121467534 isoform X1 n=1 Tax=Drosophila elegans TaxID=30023 RepID=UPI001BC83F31|nr:uncharacterized protein LOC121467534 isoform X1 [Drosophila elegans]
MVVLETASALLGGPYAQGAPALKMVQKRYIGLHQWLGPIRTKELKEHIVGDNVSFIHQRRIENKHLPLTLPPCSDVWATCVMVFILGFYYTIKCIWVNLLKKITFPWVFKVTLKFKA